MKGTPLHRLARDGDLEGLRAIFRAAGKKRLAVDAFDRRGVTPLMHAVASQRADVEVVRFLIERGADVERQSRNPDGLNRTLLQMALEGGDPGKVRLLWECGADILYVRDDGYTALIHAVHGRDVMRDASLIPLLEWLIAAGVSVNHINRYNESSLRVLSRVGRFDGVRLLLEAGGDLGQLEWTPLMRSIALDSLGDVEGEIERGGSLEARDYWERTPWLLAIQTGNVAKARLLLERGCDRNAVGRCRKPAIFYGIESRHVPMLRWLWEIGIEWNARDEFGDTPLKLAVQMDDLEVVDVLLAAGAEVDEDAGGEPAVHAAQSAAIARRLLEAGGDPQRLSAEGTRALLGFPPDEDEDLLAVSRPELEAWRAPRFGNSNPEPMDNAFYAGMIRSGVSAYAAVQLLALKTDRAQVTWCARRFGQTLTFLPDGRIVQIGGEHEDYYDPDFCIYNDVFVHEPDGSIHVLGYPNAVFPPTDFHTATLVDGFIYIIGCLGYVGSREFGTTPIYRLDTRSFKIESIAATGKAPGWIFKHRAKLIPLHTLLVSGGEIASSEDEEENHRANARAFLLDVEKWHWRPA